MAKNVELKAILDARNVTYDEGLNNAQLKKLVKDTAGADEPNTTGKASADAPETIDGDRAAKLRERIEASQTIKETGYTDLPKPSELHLLTVAKADELEKLIEVAEAADKKAADEKPKPTKGGTKIERINETTGTWWCPVCDHANGDTVKDCGGCRATRDGDKVK